MKNSEKTNLFDSDLANKHWLGKIIDNEDPENEFRCKIRVYGLFDDLEIEDIPWAYPAGNLIFAGGSGGSGSCSVPRNGTIVKVVFDNGNIYAPEYTAVQKINSTLKEEIASDYTNAHVICFDEDEKFKIHYTQGKGLYMFVKDTVIQIDNENAVYITNPNGDEIKLNNNGMLNIKTSNNITVETAKDAMIKCKNATIDASSSIKLGKNALQKIINGTKFQLYFNTHTHVSSVPGSPTSPPSIPSDPTHLSNLAFVQENP